jgi:hypothetical protein
MEKEIQLLSDWLKEQNHIPAKRVRKETLLDIAGIDHLENHLSYIYMYFLNPTASHGMSQLFVDTLQNMISKEDE